MRTTGQWLTCVLVTTPLAGCGGGNTGPQKSEQTAPGSDRTKTATLEPGASVLQAKAPIGQIAIYLDGFHPSKSDPSMQMESHHYCNQVNQDFAQCVLFDGNTARDERMHLETAKARHDRADLVPLARPQGGVDAMAGQFPGAAAQPEGVRDNGDAATEPVPTFQMAPRGPKPPAKPSGG